MGNAQATRKRRAHEMSTDEMLVPEWSNSPKRKRMRLQTSVSLTSANRSREELNFHRANEEELRLHSDQSERPQSACGAREKSSSPVFKVPEAGMRAPRKGLLRSFLSLSTGRLNEHHHDHSKTPTRGLATQFSQSISSSLNRLTQKLKRKDADHSLTSSPSSSHPTLHSSVSGSTGSLSHCVWPTPWLEAIFQPEFPSRNSHLLNAVGAGSFGEVWRVSVRGEPSILFALKRQAKRDVIARNAVAQIKEEVRVHKLLSEDGDCNQIARWYASWQSRTHLFTVLQYGDLFALWRDFGPLSEAAVTIYAMELASAIDFMHSRSVIYRDLKLENVVLDVEGHAQIVDFGLAKQLPQPDSRTRTICGTLQYMSPEVSRGEPYGAWIDWWSLGVLLHVLLTSRYPYPNAEARHHEDLRFIDYSTPLECSKLMGSFFDRILHPVIHKRIRNIEMLKMHPLFEPRNFEAAAQRRMDPLSHVRGWERCASFANTETTDDDENIEGFEENYEFNNFEYFNDRYA